MVPRDAMLPASRFRVAFVVRVAATLALAVALVGTAHPALADGGAVPVLDDNASARDAGKPTKPGAWYGWQTLVGVLPADALLVSAVATAGARDQQARTWAGFAGAVGVPIKLTSGAFVHLGHGRWGIALASLGATTGGTMLGAMLGGAVGWSMQSTCGTGDGCAARLGNGLFIGAFAGASLANFFDVSLSIEKPKRPSDALSAARTTLVPLFGSGRAGLAWAGTF